MTRQLMPPPPAAMFNEALTVFEFPKLLAMAPALLAKVADNPRDVLVVPGFGAGNASTSVLRGYLSRLGHRVEGWPFGTNDGEVPDQIEALREWVVERANQRGPLTLVGWSLGGYLSREVARDAPGAVRQVITMGSPIKGGPKYTQIAQVYRQRGYDLDEIEQQILEREQVPLKVPVTALYSQRDGVVAWQACVDEDESLSENILVDTSHSGFGFSAEVFRIVAERLDRAPPSSER